MSDNQPRLIRTINAVNIVAYQKRFYGIPQSLGAFDLPSATEIPPSILVHDTEEDLVSAIEYAHRWANSRGQFDAQSVQCKTGSWLRVDSALEEPDATPLASGYTIIRDRDGCYAVRTAELDKAFPERRAAAAIRKKAVEKIETIYVRSAHAVPELLRHVLGYNIVSYDNAFIAVPDGIAAQLETDDVRHIPGVKVARTLKDLYVEIGYNAEDRSSAVMRPEENWPQTPTLGQVSQSVPRLLSSIGNYNIVEYEGWVYGLPHSLGSVDLTETDVIGMPGVIRDVSRYVVEDALNEVLLRQRAR